VALWWQRPPPRRLGWPAVRSIAASESFARRGAKLPAGSADPAEGARARWRTSQTCRWRLGFRASQRVAANLLRELNYSCQANRKTREGANHPDRNAQFTHINATVKAAIAAGEPAISVNTKKKELVGDPSSPWACFFKNNGRELRPKGNPEPVRVHDFKIPELGKVAPYGVYDIAANLGWVGVGIDADTGAFAVESIRRWRQKLGKPRYPNAKCLPSRQTAAAATGRR
jgi:hypothetical protein